MPPKKEERKKDMLVEFGFVFLILLFLWILWTIILQYYFGSFSDLWAMLLDLLRRYIWPIIKILSVLISIALVAGIIHNYRKLTKLNKEEAKIYGAIDEELSAVEEGEKNERWEKVVAHINSANPSDWRQGIIEADVILDDLLKAEGYHGDGVGEMLKGVDKSDMLTLEAAWEAHKVRNMIAHEGSAFELNERETKRVASLYESVFREFKII